MTPRPIPPTANTRILGRFLRSERRANHLSQRQAAKLAGLSATTVLRCERGAAVLLPHVMALLRVYGYSLIVIAGQQRPVERIPA